MAAGTSTAAPMTENATNNEGMNDIMAFAASFRKVNGIRNILAFMLKCY